MKQTDTVYCPLFTLPIKGRGKQRKQRKRHEKRTLSSKQRDRIAFAHHVTAADIDVQFGHVYIYRPDDMEHIGSVAQLTMKR